MAVDCCDGVQQDDEFIPTNKRYSGSRQCFCKQQTRLTGTMSTILVCHKSTQNTVEADGLHETNANYDVVRFRHKKQVVLALNTCFWSAQL